ncbi:MAG: class I SAM-dependent methyltransferase [Candidatus Micrarchaeia archaeon]
MNLPLAGLLKLKESLDRGAFWAKMERNVQHYREKYPKIKTPPEISVPDRELPGVDFYDPRTAKSFHPILAALRTRYPQPSRLSSLVKPLQKLKVLQLAGGFGQLEELLKREGMEPVMLDASKENIRHGRKHVGLVDGLMADATLIPLKDSSVDAVVSDHFLLSGYIPGIERKVADEARRVLKKGGILVMHNVLRNPRLQVKPGQLEGWKTLYDEYPLQGSVRTVVLKKA